MTTRSTTFKKWYAELGEAVPVGLVPELLNIPWQQVAGAIRRGELPVYTFRADNGRVFRMVRLLDLQLYRKNPLTVQGMARALAAMMHSTQHGPAKRRTAA